MSTGGFSRLVAAKGRAALRRCYRSSGSTAFYQMHNVGACPSSDEPCQLTKSYAIGESPQGVWISNTMAHEVEETTMTDILHRICALLVYLKVKDILPIAISLVALFVSLRDRRPRLMLRVRKGKWCTLGGSMSNNVLLRGIVEVPSVPI